jgi:predicted permease
MRQAERTVASSPGVEAMSLSWGATPMDGDDEILFWPAGRPKPASTDQMSWALNYVVGPSYLETMGIPLVRGRFLTARDTESSPTVVVIDEVFARTYFPGEDPVGKRIYMERDVDEAVEIVGVVGHVKQWGLDQDDTNAVRAQAYLAFMQMSDKAMALTPNGVGVLVRSRTHTPSLLDSLRTRAQSIGSENVVFQARSMEDIVSDSLARRRFSMFVLGAFAVLALLLASVGIYGVISYVVSQRTNEIGIRMALGAKRGDVLRLVLGRGAKMAVAGVAIGLVAALGLTRLMGDLLYGVPPTDPVTFIAVGVGLTAIALLACYLPARRATRVDPMLALRQE